MNKTLSIIVIACLITTVFICGCTSNKDNTGNISPKTVTMTAQEFINGASFSMGMSGGVWKWTLDYKSLREGDTLILTDKIYNITYTSFLYNATTISFDTENYTKMGINASEVVFLFEGDITDQYHVGDDVRITLTVKHFVYTNETSKMSLDMEVFKEGWSQESFITHFFTQILPDSCIIKV
jgi:hypothetical protein